MRIWIFNGFTNPSFGSVCSPSGGVLSAYQMLLAWIYILLIRLSWGPDVILVRGVSLSFLGAVCQFLRSHDYFMADQSSDYLWGYRAPGCIFSPWDSGLVRTSGSNWQNSFTTVKVVEEDGWITGSNLSPRKIGALVAFRSIRTLQNIFPRIHSRCRNFRR